MAYLGDHRTRRRVLAGTIAAILLVGCSPSSRKGAGPEPPEAPVERKEIAAQSGRIALSLEFTPGTKTRYRVTTEAVTTTESTDSASREDSSAAPIAKISEASEVVFTQEIMEPVREDPNSVTALITIDQVMYSRKSPEQADLVFDSREPADGSSPFARLIGQSYTIEIHPLGYVPGVFNLHTARMAVRGPSPANSAALDLASPPAIFRRHGFFSLPGSDVGLLSIGGHWRGVQQITFRLPGAGMNRLETHRFEKIYRLESVEQRPVGTVAAVTFTGSLIPRRTTDGQPAEVPLLSCSYSGAVEFNLDTGRVEDCFEHLEVRMRPPEGPESGTVTAARSLRAQRLDMH